MKELKSGYEGINSLTMKLHGGNVNERKYKMENEWRSCKIEK